MAVGINSVKIEYQEEIKKKIDSLTSAKDSLQTEVDKLTADVLSGSAKAEIFKSELQEIIDYLQSMIAICDTAYNKLINKGDV